MTTWRHPDLAAMEAAYGLEPVVDVCHLCERTPLPESRIFCDACLDATDADARGGDVGC